MKILPFFFVSLFSITLYSQTISIKGTISDSLTGNTLPYANIIVLNTNYGTVSNNEGKFNISLDSASYKFVFSYIGFQSDTAKIIKSGSLYIKLKPVVYEMEEVIVSSLTQGERFMLNAIKKKKELKRVLKYYTADAYSKTLFKNKGIGIFGLIEVISEIKFREPDLWSEKFLSYKPSENLKNMPLEYIAMNHEMSLMKNSFILGDCEVISPLNDEALQYYNFVLIKNALMNNDTVAVIGVIPKDDGIPLLQGNMFFNTKNYQLLEADLAGNKFTKSRFVDTLSLYQKYTVKDSLFNLPSFVKISVGTNFSGFSYSYTQEYTFINYSINNPENIPVILPDKSVVADLSSNINIEEERADKFKVPLSSDENEFIINVKEKLENAAFYKKALYSIYSFGTSLIIDQPVKLFGYTFSNFSNLYRFNKVEGHYLGFEYLFMNNETASIYANAGYAININEPEILAEIRWKTLSVNIFNRVTNLGDFDYLHNLNTIGALFFHNDDLNYYKSSGGKIKLSVPLNSKLIFYPMIQYEYQTAVPVSTDYSIFNNNKMFVENFQIPDYRNNTLGFTLSYIENKYYEGPFKQVFRGGSFTNVTGSYEISSNKYFNSAEDLYQISLNVSTYQELFYPINILIEADMRYINNTRFINKMNFINSAEVIQYNENRLTFYTLDNYSYYIQNYYKINAEANLFNFPEIYFFKPSLGIYFSLVHPLYEKNLNTGFEYLSKNFYEYGITLKGLTIINLYFLMNSNNYIGVKLTL